MMMRQRVLGMLGLASLVVLPLSAEGSGRDAQSSLSECWPCLQQMSLPSIPALQLGQTVADAAAQLDPPPEKIEQPTQRTCNSVTYRIPERRLAPGESLDFEVPADMRGRPVQFIILGHRQNPDSGGTGESKWDETPGLTSIQLLDESFADDPWRYWGGSASGDKGAKFAEPGYSVELENLYEWPKLGHRGVKTDETSHAPLRPSRMRASSLGKDPVLVSELALKVLPERPKTYEQAVFTEGTAMGDHETLEGQKFGGGQDFGGKFPGALALNGYTDTPIAHPKLPEGWRATGSELTIPLKAGQTLNNIEVAGGDSHPDGIKNPDGGSGMKGWAKLSIGLRRADGKTVWMMERENVPPEGVLMASPKDCNTVIGEGDQLVIQARDDTTYLMAVRVGTR